MELNTIKGRTHWKPFVPPPDSALVHKFHERRKATLQDLSADMMGLSFDFEGLILGVTAVERGISMLRLLHKISRAIKEGNAACYCPYASEIVDPGRNISPCQPFPCQHVQLCPDLTRFAILD